MISRISDRNRLAAAALLILTLALAACEPTRLTGEEDPLFTEADWDVIRSLSPLPPPPVDPTNRVSASPAAAALGQMFFFDPAFSGPLIAPGNSDLLAGGNGPVGPMNPDGVGRISCSRCHSPARAFIDIQSVPNNASLGASWSTRNSPTLLNASQFEFLHGGGLNDSLWAQALRAVESPQIQNFNRVGVVQQVFDRYRASYEAIFGAMPDFRDPTRFPQVPNPPAFDGQGRPGDGPGGAGLDTYDEMTAADQTAVDTAFANWGKAIGAYERLLATTDSLFDRFVRGERDALSPSAQRGLAVFIGRGFCINCHNGPRFSDGEFHNLGLAQGGPNIPPIDRGRADELPLLLSDRFNGAGAFSDDPAAGAAKLAGLAPTTADLGSIRTPTLRNVASTAPYMHTGNLSSLYEVIRFYDRGGDGSGFSGTPDARIGPPLGLTDQEMEDLALFLASLDGAPPPPALLSTPVLPP